MRPLTIAVLAAAALLVPASASSAARSCGTVNSGFENTITAVGVDCPSARAVVRAWHFKAVNQGRGPGGSKYVGSYICTSHSAGDPEHVVVNCANHTKKIRFVAGP
ncbi:MAG: hypothetical protein JWM73_1476 [Solirubrobacterales bacterium]|jgi:hypothetical protein|nr:hypothetical protein [Solirubrobacterales bacterium]